MAVVADRNRRDLQAFPLDAHSDRERTRVVVAALAARRARGRGDRQIRRGPRRQRDVSSTTVHVVLDTRPAAQLPGMSDPTDCLCLVFLYDEFCV